MRYPCDFSLIVASITGIGYSFPKICPKSGWRFMIVEKRSRLRRLLGFVAFRLIPLFLLVGILLTGYQVAQGLVKRISEQSDAANHQPLFVQTATALAMPQATPAAGADGGEIKLADYRQADLALQFDTNT